VDGRLRRHQEAYALWFPLDLDDPRAVQEGGEPFMVVSLAQTLLGRSLCDGRFEDLPPDERLRVHQEARRVIEHKRPEAFRTGGVAPSVQADGMVRLDLPTINLSSVDDHLTAVRSPTTGDVQDVQCHLSGDVRAVYPGTPLWRLLVWSLDAADRGLLFSPLTAD
jgi:hypothetical protein